MIQPDPLAEMERSIQNTFFIIVELPLTLYHYPHREQFLSRTVMFITLYQSQ